MTLRFIGSESEVGGRRLSMFGQAFELPDAEAQELVFGPGAKCPVLPQAEFDKVGFTSQELESYQYPSTHADAPATFLQKKRDALQRLGLLRSGAVQTNSESGGDQ